MEQYKITVLGSRGVGKTALVHYMTNMSPYGPQYIATKEPELRHRMLAHSDPEIGQCSIALEDTPGFKALDRENNAPDLLEPKICYMWCDDGVRKPGAEDPDAELPEAKSDEKTPLVGSELKGVSPIDSNLDRQGFVIVYNPLDKDSFTAAEGLVAALKEKMAKPDTEVENEDEEDPQDDEDEAPEKPNYPFVIVATHADLKNRDKKIKNVVEKEKGDDLAQSFGGKFYEVNASGKNVMKALLSVVTAIHQVELNLVYDKEEGGCEKYCKKCTIM